MRALVLLAMAVLVSCVPRGNKLPEVQEGRAVYIDKATGFDVRFNEWDMFTGQRGEVGEIHPAVLEYVLSAEESPLTAYYDLILALPSPPKLAAVDLASLAAEAKKLAGAEPVRGRHYARALAYRLAPWINIALHLKFDDERYNDLVHLGTASLWWGLAADLDANVLQRRYERSLHGTKLRTVIFRHASAGLIAVRSSGTDRLFVWDIGAIKGAFDPSVPLDYDTVAKEIVALHPFTTTPARAER